MTKIERDKILELTLNKISKTEYLKFAQTELDKIENHVLGLINKANKIKNAEDLEFAFLLSFSFDVPTIFDTILCELLTASWHSQHENIALILKRIKSPKSVDCLKYAIEHTHELDYLAYNDGEALIDKCLWALGDITSEYAIEILRLLCVSNNQFVRDGSRNQLLRKGLEC